MLLILIFKINELLFDVGKSIGYCRLKYPNNTGKAYTCRPPLASFQLFDVQRSRGLGRPWAITSHLLFRPSNCGEGISHRFNIMHGNFCLFVFKPSSFACLVHTIALYFYCRHTAQAGLFFFGVVRSGICTMVFLFSFLSIYDRSDCFCARKISLTGII